MSNMRAIYGDVDRVLGIADQQLQNLGFKPVGDSAVLWDSSAALGGSGGWMPRYLARCDTQQGTSDRAIGFGVHLGAYDDVPTAVLDSLGLTLPLVNATLLKGREKIPMDRDHRRDLLNSLWNAGWWDGQEEQKIDRGRLVPCSTEPYPADSVTYFLGLLELKSKEAIKTRLTDPLARMHAGNETWILDHDVPALAIKSGATHAGG
jgi:hypothetical protein